MIIVNKDKCSGCGTCVQSCPKGVRIGDDGKAQIFDQKELEICGGKSICPFGAMEETEEGGDNPVKGSDFSKLSQKEIVSTGRGGGRRIGHGRALGRGIGRGRGMGRGLGRKRV